MEDDADLAELSAHYARGEECGRLDAGRGLLEFTRELAASIDNILESLGCSM